MNNLTLRSQNKWEIPPQTGQFANRYELRLNAQKVIVIEHYSEAQEKINKNIVDALNNYDSLLEALKKIAECEGLKLDASDAKGFIQIAKAAIQKAQQ